MCQKMTDIKLWLLYSNSWNHLTVYKKTSGSFKNVINKMCLQIIYINCIYIKKNLVLNNIRGAYDKFPDFFRTGI